MFAALGAMGEKPLSTEKRVLHIEEQGDVVTAMLDRCKSETTSNATVAA
jgi:hypothetical protein